MTLMLHFVQNVRPTSCSTTTRATTPPAWRSPDSPTAPPGKREMYVHTTAPHILEARVNVALQWRAA